MNTTFNDAILEKATDIANLVINKQMDYGKNNILKFGEIGIKVRSSDKRERLKTLLSKIDELAESKPLNEPLNDTWKDIIGYALLALMVEDGTFNLPLKPRQYIGGGRMT